MPEREGTQYKDFDEEVIERLGLEWNAALLMRLEIRNYPNPDTKEADEIISLENKVGPHTYKWNSGCCWVGH